MGKAEVTMMSAAATTRRLARTKYYAGAEPELEVSHTQVQAVNHLPGHMPAQPQPFGPPHEWLDNLLVPQGFDILVPEASSVHRFEQIAYTPVVASLPTPEKLKVKRP